MATQAALRQAIRDNLFSAYPEEKPFVHQIDGGINDAVTTIAVDDGTFFDTGDVIEFNEGEQCYVVSVAANNLTVIRAWNGTTAAAQSDNDYVLKNPRFTIQQIDQSVANILNDLARKGIYTWGTGDITLVANQTWYDLTETDIHEQVGVVALYYADSTTARPLALPFTWSVELDSNVSTTGHGIHAWTWGDKAAGDTLYFTYAKVIDAVGDLMTRHDQLVEYGATAQTLAKAIGPATHEPGARTDRTVPPGQVSRDATWYRAEYFIALKEEQALLKAERTNLPGTLETKRARRWKA